MSTVNKANAVPTVTEAKIALPDMLRSVIVSAKATRTAALDLCYAAATFILLANHFKDAKAKDYMTRSDAREYLQKQIKAQAQVEGGMLDLYIRNADKLAAILTGSAKMFSPVLQRIGTAEKPETATAELSKWADANLLKITGSGDRQTSMRALSEALGYSTGRKPATGGGLVADPKAVNDRIANTIKTVEKLVTGDGDKTGKKIHARVVTSAIVNAIPQMQSFSLAKEAVKRITDSEELDMLETAIKDQRKALQELSAKAKASAADKAKEATPAKVHGKGGKRGQRTPVEHSQA